MTNTYVLPVIIALAFVYPYSMAFAFIYRRLAESHILSVPRLACSLVLAVACSVIASIWVIKAEVKIEFPAIIPVAAIFALGGMLLPAVIVSRMTPTEKGRLPLSHAAKAHFFMMFTGIASITVAVALLEVLVG